MNKSLLQGKMQPEKNVLDKNQLQIFYEERLSSLILLCDSTVKQRDWTTLPSKIWIFLPSLTLKKLSSSLSRPCTGVWEDNLYSGVNLFLVTKKMLEWRCHISKQNGHPNGYGLNVSFVGEPRWKTATKHLPHFQNWD